MRDESESIGRTLRGLRQEKAPSAVQRLRLPRLHAGEQSNFGGGLGEREAERSLPQLGRDARIEILLPACGRAK